jgi:hypothetical protein
MCFWDLNFQAENIQRSVGVHIRLPLEAVFSKNFGTVGSNMISYDSMLHLPRATFSRVCLWCIRLDFFHMDPIFPELLAELTLNLIFGTIHDHDF